jgi:hypothetical protein
MNPRNYRKNPHTASFLQTFHSGIGSNGRNYREEMGVDTEERAAMEFVTGRPAAPAVSRYTEARYAHIKGYKIRLGDGLITEKQAKWVVDIAETKANVTDAMIKSLSERLEQGFAKQAASEFITRYKDWPRKEVTAAAAEAIAPGASTQDITDVEAGRYALIHQDGIKFYRVSKGKGKWAGRTFVDAQASDDFYPVRNPQARKEILAAIAEAPYEAMVRYGHELGVCGRCGRTLTDEASRAAGIGPVCASK